MTTDEIFIASSAYHEAGHAVAFYFYKFTFDDVILPVEDGCAGGVRGVININQTSYNSEIISALAGPASEFSYLTKIGFKNAQRIVDQSGMTDLSTVNDMLGEEAVSLLPSFKGRARDFVNDLKDMIREVAEELISKRQLSFAEVAAICDSHLTMPTS